MDRAAFATVLKNLAPALSKRDLVPVFSCYCFDGKKVHTYDDVVAIETDFAFPVPGAYRGDLLVQWANSVKGKEVEVSEKGTTAQDVVFSCGRSKISLPHMPTENFLFAPPSSKKSSVLDLGDELVGAVGRVLPCAARDATYPWQYGVTIRATSKRLDVFATNNLAAARTTVSGKPDKMADGDVLLLPPRFCDLLVEFGKANTLRLFSVYGDSGVMAMFDNGVRIYSKVGTAADVSRYDQTFSKERMDQIKAQIRPAPKGLVATINRASLVLDAGDSHKLKFTCKEDRLTVHGKSAHGEVKEVLKFPDHEAGTGNVDPDYLRPTLDTIEEIAFFYPKVIAARGNDTTYLFSFTHDKEE